MYTIISTELPTTELFNTPRNFEYAYLKLHFLLVLVILFFGETQASIPTPGRKY